MFNKVVDYLNQPSSSSFRMVNKTPHHAIPSLEPKIEPLWKSVLLDFPDASLAILDAVTTFVQSRVKLNSKAVLEK